jgi:hypothetical protein
MDIQSSENIVRLRSFHRVHHTFMGLGPGSRRSLGRTREPFPLRRCYEPGHCDGF